MQLPVIPEEFTDREEDATLMDIGNCVSSSWRPFLERILERPVPKGFYEVVPEPELSTKLTHAGNHATTMQAPSEVEMTLRDLRTCGLLTGKIVTVVSQLEKWTEAHARVWSAYNLLHRGCRSIDARLVQHLSSTWLEHDAAAQNLLEQVKSKRCRWLEFNSSPSIVGGSQVTIRTPHGSDHPPRMGRSLANTSGESSLRLAQLKKAYVRMEALASRVKRNVCSLYAAQAGLYAAILNSRPDFFTVEDAGPAGIDLERAKAEWDGKNEAIFRHRVAKMLRERDNVPVPMWSIPAGS
ncbi:hypothetical protein CLAIMM_12245 [Cladophialophora immunda]|nr:hypothetical protein CLAIMM_12245 [Cladophialophora immunda]